MNTELTHQWVENSIGIISFTQRLLARGCYKCHIEDFLKKSLATIKIDTIFIPGRCTKYLQASDVSRNKTFKAIYAEEYDDWLAAEELNNEAEAGNLKTSPQKDIIKWILDA